jgi:signal transduction histidine kinase
MIQLQEAADLGVRVSMNKPKNRLFCRLDGLSTAQREQKRTNAIEELGLLETETILVFDEATQTAARSLGVPICILGLIVDNKVWFKSASGLSRIGLMNQLASYRMLPLEESFSTYVIDSQQELVVDDALQETIFANSALVQHYGIRSYLGTPLITSEGQCIGTLEVMDLEPRQFTSRDVDFLMLTARWCLGEYEKQQLIKTYKEAKKASLPTIVADKTSVWQVTDPAPSSVRPVEDSNPSSTNAIKLKLLTQLSQELRTPLTSVIGMASVLKREIYGTLTVKQKEYIEIIHNSGQHLISLVDEIVNLGVFDENSAKIQKSSIDIEMICQQAVNSLYETAQQQGLELRLSVEPGNRIWSLDRDKVKQAVYYLVVSVIESSDAGGEVRLHVSRKQQTLNVAVWISHPWLGDGLPSFDLYPSSTGLSFLDSGNSSETTTSNSLLGTHVLTSTTLLTSYNKISKSAANKVDRSPRQILGLLLSCHLAELHGGGIVVQGSQESGYRYILKLPQLTGNEG